MFLANEYEKSVDADKKVGYKIRYNGEISTSRFINTLDYSLDLLKLRDVYAKTYRRNDFSFRRNGKEYTTRIINVTFKYSIKEYNKLFNNVYVKYGYSPDDIKLDDCLYYDNGVLVAVKVDTPMTSQFDTEEEQFKKYFLVDDGGIIRAKMNIKVVHTVADLRKKLYQDGFYCDGIKFRRFKRSAGSSRVGKCLFIDEKMYSRMHVWELGGITIKQGQKVDLAALESYISLTLSSIIDTIQIKPKNFLVVDDYESVFTDKVVATRVVDGWLESKPDEVEIRNSIWDGQSLMDVSLFDDKYRDKGMLLLRNRFFKSACFNTNIQQFFADNGITSVSQLNGQTCADDIADIKVITTPSSIKYLKFGTLDAWFNMISQEFTDKQGKQLKGYDFGIVKYDKPTPYFDGEMVQLHYQLLNTLQLDEGKVQRLVQPSLDYLTLIRENPAVLRYYIKYPTTEHNVGRAETANDVVYQMLGVTDEFCKTKLYYDFREDILQSYVKNLRHGHLLVNGNYSTLLGNPVEMLYNSIGKFDGDSMLGIGNIHSKAFDYDKTILGSRSPHVTMGNVWLPRNVDDEAIRRYFNLSKEVVCINSIGENLLQRLSGADFDADTVLLTDNEILIEAAKRNYDNFLVPTSLVEAKKTSRYYTAEQQADLDIKTSVNKIGEIINLSQELNTKLWDSVNNGSSLESVMALYYDIAKLDVMSGIEIDKAKKEFVVDNVAELKRLKKKYDERSDDDRLIKPNFFGGLAREKGFYDSKRKSYDFHDTTMDYLQRSLNRYRHSQKSRKFIPFSSLLFVNNGFNRNLVKSAQIKQVVDAVRKMKSDVSAIWNNSADGFDNDTKFVMMADIRKKHIANIKDLQFNENTAYYLLTRIEAKNNKDISRSLFYSLFSAPNQSFINLIRQSTTPIGYLELNDGGDISIYGRKYAICYKN